MHVKRRALGGSSDLVFSLVERSGMLGRAIRRGAFLTALLLASTESLAAQTLAPPLSRWRAAPVVPPGRPVALGDVRLFPHAVAASPSHSHVTTGLLIGGIVGAVTTGMFLAAFCSDPDTRCGADEVGRAVVIIALPPTVLGAVIGSLIRTKA